jgi:hypothetical protein
MTRKVNALRDKSCLRNLKTSRRSLRSILYQFCGIFVMGEVIDASVAIKWFVDEKGRDAEVVKYHQIH